MSADWMQIGTLEEIPVLGSRVVETPTGEIAVFRNAQDEVFALSNKCPHKGGPLSEGIVSGRTVACPLHNLVMDMSCGEAVTPDTGCVPTYPTKIENGQVFLSITDIQSVA